MFCLFWEIGTYRENWLKIMGFGVMVTDLTKSLEGQKYFAFMKSKKNVSYVVMFYNKHNAETVAYFWS